MESNSTLEGKYKLGEVLGVGGWGTVYKTLDIQNGSIVAAKEIGLSKIPKGQLGNIMSEITLLKSLSHPLVVKYIDSFKTEYSLYIILEYVEGGSLELIAKKFGCFPEHLLSRYIHQVLEGLSYLHGEGVIHRDIKGANILATKSGQVKLTDFGVAVRDKGPSDVEKFDPAGSPYWMAPEMVEMNGITTKSDIWSLGCTIIELYTSRPPYSNLAPMGALFRIVQDDMPPLPEGISSLLRDLLMKCFQKEPFLRSSAETLLKHRWFSAHAKMTTEMQIPISAQVQQALEEYNKRLMAQLELKKMGSSLYGEGEDRSRRRSRASDADGQAEEGYRSDSSDWGSDFEGKRVEGEMSARPICTASIDDAILEEDWDDGGTEKIEAADDENWDDIEGFEEVVEDVASEFSNRLTMKMHSQWDSSKTAVGDLEDIFEDESFEVSEDERSIMNDYTAHAINKAVSTVDYLNTITDEDLIFEKCTELAALFEKYPKQRRQIIDRTGVILFVELLKLKNTKIALIVLKILSGIAGDQAAIESFAVIGGFLATLQYTNGKYSTSLRMEACSFAKKILNSGQEVVKIFISSNAPSALVDCISVEEDFYFKKELFLTGLDCILLVFNSKVKIKMSMNDFCRLFAKAQLLVHLTRALKQIVKEAAISEKYTNPIADILITFSKGDCVVKSYICDQEVLKNLLHLLDDLAPSTYLRILKSINAVSMSPNTLHALQMAGTIKVLVKFMARREGAFLMESQQQLFSALYNLCRLDVTRQLQAAKAGAIPHLKWAIENNYVLKQFALPIFFEMSRNKKTRAELFKFDCVNFFLDLFKQPYPWQVQAIDSVSYCLADDNRKVSLILGNRVDCFVELFATANDESLLSMLEIFHKILKLSKSFNRVLCDSPFLDLLLARINHPNPLVRVSLMKLLRAFYEVHPSPQYLVKEFGLLEILRSMEQDEKVLVAEMARKLVSQFSKTLRKHQIYPKASHKKLRE
ncbi:serine/threonine-protein kinase sepA-like [Schistocerca gregaria]|uniref:serine/threonine-protein kinase sepA-like n=1 Tax=Schistocerca gregaria TaxID=7010 RepID=UPI00211E6ECC|nr:serine/threonine-protein kinase sepA-like [Schistocerca gregaria]